MLPTSLAIVLATLALTLVPAAVLAWAWRRGLLRDLDAQSRIIFEPRDWRVERPWESPAERLTSPKRLPERGHVAAPKAITEKNLSILLR